MLKGGSNLTYQTIEMRMVEFIDSGLLRLVTVNL